MKKTIMLFAGTTEGRRICEFLAVKKCITHVYVTTEYGKDLLPEQNNVHIHAVSYTHLTLPTILRV